MSSCPSPTSIGPKRFYQNLGWRLDADFPISDQLRVVQDINAARADLVARGVDVGHVFHNQSLLQAGTTGRVPGPAPHRRTYGFFASFSDPDGNGYVLQEITQRLPGYLNARLQGGTSEQAAAAAGRYMEQIQNAVPR